MISPVAHFADATALADAIRTGQVSAREAMADTLKRIDQCGDLGALRHVDAALGLQLADGFDGLHRTDPAQTSAMPFGGVPFLMKDLGAQARGLAACAGSQALLARAIAPIEDDALAARFRAAGLLPFGITTTPELGLALSSEPAMGPVARNPFDLSLTPGGSSGGAATAVAAGLVPIAHATDAAGSIRVPAACCGLVGLKPSRGATPMGPSFHNLLMGLVGELVLARSVRDVATALRVCSGTAMGPSADPVLRSGHDGTLRIGLVEVTPGIGVPQAQALRTAANWLSDAGHDVRPVEFEPFRVLAQEAHACAMMVLVTGTASWVDSLSPPAGPEEFAPVTFAIVAEGRAVSGTDLFEASRRLAAVAHRVWLLSQLFDVLLMPMLTRAPPEIGHFPYDLAGSQALSERMVAFAPFAALANASGVPALSAPMGLDPDGLPLSVQLMGPIGSDFELLRLAAWLESRAPHPRPVRAGAAS